jgi:hypothetical protein
MSDEKENGEIGADPLGTPSSDPPPPASPGRRRLAMVFAMLFIAVILVFLVWFIAANADRDAGGGYFGAADTQDIRVRVLAWNVAGR